MSVATHKQSPPKHWVCPLVALRACAHSVTGWRLRFNNIRENSIKWWQAVYHGHYTAVSFEVSRRLVPILLRSREVALQLLDRLAEACGVSDVDDYDELTVATSVLDLMRAGGLVMDDRPSSPMWTAPSPPPAFQEEDDSPSPLQLVQHIVRRADNSPRECATCLRQEDVLAWARLPCEHDVCVECDVAIRSQARQRGVEPQCPLCCQPRFRVISKV